MKKLLTLTLLSIQIFATDALYEDDVTPKEAYKMQQKGALLIDVRTPSEFIYAGHALGAINVPYVYFDFEPKDVETRIKASQYELTKKKAADSFKLYLLGTKKNKKFIEDVKKIVAKLKPKAILVICRSGERSEHAANDLAKAGLQNVYNVEDGFIFGWKKEKLPWGSE